MPLLQFIGLGICVGVGQCERTIKVCSHWRSAFALLPKFNTVSMFALPLTQRMCSDPISVFAFVSPLMYC